MISAVEEEVARPVGHGVGQVVEFGEQRLALDLVGQDDGHGQQLRLEDDAVAQVLGGVAGGQGVAEDVEKGLGCVVEGVEDVGERTVVHGVLLFWCGRSLLPRSRQAKASSAADPRNVLVAGGQRRGGDPSKKDGGRRDVARLVGLA